MNTINRLICALGVALTSALGISSALAAEQITNGSFESNLTSWTGTGNYSIQSAAPYSPTNGSRLLAFNNSQSTPNGVISQSFATTPGTSYQLAFDMGAYAYNSLTQRLQVTVTGSSSLLSQTLSVAGIGGGNTRWLAKSFSFVANSTTTTLTFRDVSTTSNAIDLVLDNVRVTDADADVSRTLTVESTPVSGVAIGLSPADRNGASGGNTTFTRSYGEGTAVTLTAPTTASGSSFSKWQKDGLDYSTNPTATVSMNAAVTMTAVYTGGVSGFANGSFEAGLASWTGTGNYSVQSAPYTPTNGSRLLAFNNSQSTPNGVISQSFATIPGKNYQLSFDMGALAYNTLTQRLQVTVTGSSSLLSQTLSVVGIGGGKTRWLAQSFSFVANSENTTLTFRDVSTTSFSIDLLLDNVRVTDAVDSRNLTVNTSPTASKQITVTPSDNTGQGNGITNFTRNYATGTAVTLVAPSVGFVKWQRNGIDAATTASTTVTMDSNITMTAVYTEPPSGTNLIFNPSFELSSPPSNWVGWEQSGSNRIEWPGPAYSTSGSKILSYSVGNAPANGRVSQTFGTVPGTTYQLDLDVGALGGIAAEQRLLITVTGSGTRLSETASIFGPSGLVMVWAHKTYTFTANSTNTTLTLSDVSGYTQGMDMFVDTISVVALGSAAPPSEQSEAYVPQGLVSQATAEQAAVQPEPAKLDITPTLSGTPGAYKIGLNATQPGLYSLERSEDLQEWNFHSQIDVTEPRLIEFEETEPGKTRMFYRVGWQARDTGN